MDFFVISKFELRLSATRLYITALMSVAQGDNFSKFVGRASNVIDVEIYIVPLVLYRRKLGLGIAIPPPSPKEAQNTPLLSDFCRRNFSTCIIFFLLSLDFLFRAFVIELFTVGFSLA